MAASDDGDQQDGVNITRGLDRQQCHPLALRRRSQFFVDAGKRKAAANRQFQVGGIVYRELMPSGQVKGARPGMAARVAILRDRQLLEIGERVHDKTPPASTAPDTHFEHVGYLRPPEQRNPAALFANAFEDLPHLLRRLIDKHPCGCDRTVQNQTHGRPESRSALRSVQSKCPNFRLFARFRTRSAADRALWVSIVGSLGTRRATRRPCRVITISSPCSTRSKSVPNLFLASKAPNSCISSLV